MGFEVGGGSYFFEARLGREGLFERGFLFNLTKCFARSKKEEETDESYGTLLPVLELEQEKTTIATNNKQPEDGVNSP